RGLPPPPEGAGQECRELADRAVVVTYRDAPAEEGAPAPPAPRAPRTEHLERALARAVVQAYGGADWIGDGNFRPRRGGGALPLRKLPAGTWKLTDRGDTFELFEIESRAHLTVARSSCARFWASPPAGQRVAAPSFLPRVAGAAIVDARERWVGASCFALLGSEAVVTIALAHAPDEATARALAAALTEPDSPRSSIALVATSESIGFSLESWAVGRLSGIGQLEILESGPDASGKHESFRLALGLGPGFS